MSAWPRVRLSASLFSIFGASESFCLSVETCGLSSCSVNVFRHPVTYRLLKVTGAEEVRGPSTSRGEKREKETTKLTSGLWTTQCTRECGWQDRQTVDG